jgi:uncharacterized protein
MSDFIVALGLVLVIEGLLWAAFPSLGRTLIELAAARSEQQNRNAGLVAAAVGVFIVWLIRG